MTTKSEPTIMTPDRIAARLDRSDRQNLNTIAAALADDAPTGSAPWQAAVTLTECLKVALKVAADAARSGGLTNAR